MDNQDKIFDKFKEAAHNSEQKEFPGMDKVWARVEEKLDKKEDKKAISLWKKIAIAASLLLLISLGAQFFKSDQNTTIPTSKVVVKETEQEEIQNSEIKKDAVVIEDSKIIPKAEAAKILEKQIKTEQTTVANNEAISVADAVSTGTASMPVYEEANAPISESVYSSGFVNDEERSAEKDKAVQDFGYSKKIERESYKAAQSEQKSQVAKKSTPLVILNGRAMSHSDDAKRDQMMTAELPNLKPENVESLVVLDEPLYIIDGIYYSENDLFGNNPTSPYAPLNKQEIKTITILQDTEAVAKYGEKGKKGVVIITTKNGKPAPKN